MELPNNWTAEEDFRVWKRDIAAVYEQPMKERVYPTGSIVKNLHAFFVNEEGTWFRRLGSYPIMVVVKERQYPRYESRDVMITRHAGRYIYGQALET